jgi:hypothetical protein
MIFMASRSLAPSGQGKSVRFLPDAIHLSGSSSSASDVDVIGIASTDISDTRGQMQVFDRLLIDRTITKIVDLGSGPFDLFFAVMEKIDLVTEARRQLIEPIVLFVADPEAETARTYADLKRRLRSTIFVPVYNEAVSVTFAAQAIHLILAACGP